MIRSLWSRLRSAGQSVWHFVLETQIARLVIIAWRLWPDLKLPSALVALLVCGCLFLAVATARTVHLTLAPASPTGIGAWLAAALAFLLVLELAALTATAGLGLTLQLALDLGRHRIAALLALATLLAVAATLLRLNAGEALGSDAAATFGITAVLLALTVWFERRYRNPGWRRFRDFHVDVVEARRFLMRAAHGV
jgi:hypothetical protein